ncbi:MAG TPA: 50S ribosomal protein L2 [Candidatus Saccharimonadales bacterium]|nr:50S ribosomal protein L2 [Candidatus Saccharimonadales bacterium]
MAIKLYNPTTPARRGMTSADTSTITKKRPQKSLLVVKKAGTGRNNQGRITVRHRGAGVKNFYRLVDFKALWPEAKVVAIEYDPNRSARIALVQAEGGQKAYVLAGANMKVGDKLSTGEKAPIRAGNRLPLKAMPVGSSIYNIELTLGRGGQLVRSAGARAQLVAKEGEFCQVKLPSGEVRLINQNCSATLGNVGNESHQNIKYGSAGRRRRLGWRPAVRGKAMNPVDHPHGGGEGAHDIGLRRGPTTPWGKPALGYKTRRRKLTNAMIVRGRKEGRRR